jgi:hypothetical protein
MITEIGGQEILLQNLAKFYLAIGFIQSGILFFTELHKGETSEVTW